MEIESLLQVIEFKHCLINQRSRKYNYSNDKLIAQKNCLTSQILYLTINDILTPYIFSFYQNSKDFGN